MPRPLKFILKIRGGHWKALKEKLDLIGLDFHFRQIALGWFYFYDSVIEKCIACHKTHSLKCTTHHFLRNSQSCSTIII